MARPSECTHPDAFKGVRPVRTDDAGTMAAETAEKRWPKTLQNMISDVEETSKQAEARQAVEGALIVDALFQLKSDVTNNEVIRPLIEDGSPDIALYNEELATLGACSWKAAPWMFAECYMYRYVQSLLTRSSSWKGYDIFKRQKDSTFASSRIAVEELASRFMEVIASGLDRQRTDAARLLFEEMTQIALWGNATDLSLLTNLSLDEIKGLQGKAAIERNRRNIVSNDTNAMWAYLSTSTHTRIDIVLDNAGFEFFTDLIYASYLLYAGLCKHVVLHAKDFPWFVSDVTPQDITGIMNDLARQDLFTTRESLDPLIQLLLGHFDQGELSVQTHPFWTTGVSFQQMPVIAPDLWHELRSSDLVYFKGDLNYRKLLNDATWPYTTCWSTALGPLSGASGLTIASLRTNKADVCVGVASDRLAELEKEAPRSAWVKNGKYAVISFSKGK